MPGLTLSSYWKHSLPGPQAHQAGLPGNLSVAGTRPMPVLMCPHRPMGGLMVGIALLEMFPAYGSVIAEAQSTLCPFDNLTPKAG